MAPDKTQLTPERAMELLREVVAEYGEDFVYTKVVLVPKEDSDWILPECVYQEDGAPSCLVGHVLSRAGFSSEDLIQFDSVGSSADFLKMDAGEETETDALPLRTAWILVGAQQVQDEGNTWGEALRNATNRAKDLVGPR